MTLRPLSDQRRGSATVHPFPNPSMVAIVLGAQWGDEVSDDHSNNDLVLSKISIRAKANWWIYWHPKRI